MTEVRNGKYVSIKMHDPKDNPHWTKGDTSSGLITNDVVVH